MQVRPIKTRIFRENEDLLLFVIKTIKKLPEKSILVISSKIVALSEGRTTFNTTKNREYWIKRESDITLKNSWFSIKDNIVMPAAGIDESNGRGKLILLPKNSFESAQKIRQSLKKKFGVKNFGVLITDSNFLPLRRGAIGIALGYAGFQGIRNYIGKKDIFGRKLKYSTTNIPDSLATSAVLCMGEGKEKQPLAMITEAPVIFTEKVKRKELIINPKKDIYAPLFNKIN